MLAIYRYRIAGLVPMTPYSFLRVVPIAPIDPLAAGLLLRRGAPSVVCLSSELPPRFLNRDEQCPCNFGR